MSKDKSCFIRHADEDLWQHDEELRRKENPFIEKKKKNYLSRIFASKKVDHGKSWFATVRLRQRSSLRWAVFSQFSQKRITKI